MKLNDFKYIALFILASTFAHAQQIDPTTNYMPSPDAIALEKYGDVSVGYHTGSAGISIPLYTLQGKKLSVPISLSYNSGGIRVDEVASAVGLGWSLNAGGVITRTVRGLPDEDPHGWLNEGAISEVLSNAGKQKSALRGELDTEADEFFYNFLGYTGKFIISKGGEVRTIPFNNLKIIPSSDLMQFTIQTPDGSTYLFAATESGTNETYCDQSHDEPHFPVTSSWYLTEFKNTAISNEKIIFKYRLSEITYLSSYSAEAYGRPLILQSGVCNFNCSKPSDDQCIRISRTEALFLDSIITEVGYLVFHHRERLDLGGGLAYDSIVIFGSTNQIMQKISLNQSYFHCPGRSFDQVLHYTFDSTETHFRLRLDSIDIIGQPDGILRYSLSYHDSIPLPPRLSFAQDYWGYYNGKTSNISLLPYTQGAKNDNYSIKLADRRPSSDFVSTGMLKTIKYPTGGTTSYEYESHDYENQPDSIEKLVSKQHFIGHEFDSVPIDTFSFCEFESNVLYEVEIDYTWILNQPDEILVDIDGGSEFHSIYIGPDDGNGSATAKIPYIVDSCMTFTIRSYGSSNSLSIDRIRYKVLENVLIEEGISLVGGTRIKEIISDDLQSNILRRTFKYIKENGSSSGHLNFQPVFDGARGSSFLCPSSGTVLDCYWSWKNTNSIVPLGESNGSHIFYERVEEYYNEGNLGKSIFEYNIVLSTRSEIPGIQIDNLLDKFLNTALVGKSLNNENWKSGFLMQESHYQGNSSILEKSYKYNFNATPQRDNKTIESIGVPVVPNSVILHDTKFPYVLYKQYSNWYTLDTIIERFYDGAGINYVEKRTTNTYDPDNLMQIASSFVNCDGAVYTSNNVYKQIGDFDEEVGQYAILNEENTSSKNAQIISGIKNVYPTTGDLQLPTEIYNYEGSYGWDLYGTYGSYSSDGFPESFTKAFYPPVNYTWNEGLLVDQNFVDFDWHFGYDDNTRKIDSLVQVDGQVITYAYDGLQRQNTMTQRGGNRVTSYTYTLGGPNIITTSISFADAPTRTTEKYFDGFGRYLRTNSIAYDPQGGGNVITDGGFLDPLGRMIKQVFLPDTYQTNTYEGSPHGRMLKTTFPDGASIRQEYPYTSYFVTKVIDENNHPTTTTTDLVDKTHQVMNAINGITAYFYNGFDNIDSITTPVGNAYHYGYDTKQRMTSKSVPGGGSSSYSYNDRDLVQSITDANSKVTNKTYDVHNRDSVVTIDNVPIEYSYQVDRLVSKETESFNSVTLSDDYTYDAYGRIMTQNSVTIAGNDEYDFEYLHSDLMTSNTRQHPDVTINQDFVYDNWGRQNKHQFGIGGGPSATIQANAWNKRDELIKKGLGGETGKILQGQSYKYHIRGWLTDINNVESGSDLTQFVACDTIPPGDSIPDFFGNNEQENDTTFSIQDILDRRFHQDFALGGFDRCTLMVCDTLDCDSITKLQQLTDITEILQMMKDSLLEENTIVCEGTSLLTTHTGNARSYLIPSKLFRIRLCDGSEYYIPEQFLNELSGTYTILQEIPVTDINQTFNIQNKSRSSRATLSELLPNIADGENLEINNYTSCQVEDCLEVTPPVCDSASTTAQNHFLDSLKAVNNNIDASTFGYPMNLVKVLLCNGTEVYLLESELSQLPGNYTSIQTIPITDEDQQILVEEEEPNYASGILFSEKIFYDIGTTTLEGPEQRNGNIAHLYWQVAGKTPKGYGFTYDPINRLLQGTYGEVLGNGGISQIIKSERYSAYGITYDADGNLETLTRNGPIGTCPSGLEYGVIDQLDYTIVGNRMTSLADAATRDGYFPGLSSSYGYDGAGNMNSVGPTGVTLTYNALNLPQTANNGMTWDYGADGRKVKYEGLSDTREYADGIEYVNEEIFIYHPEGRVYRDTSGEWRYEYSLKDHLGNTRVVFADVDRDGLIVDTIDVLREAHYYPFGMEMVGPWSMTSDTLHPYLYNGKEFNHDSTDVDEDGKNELALGWYDFGARWYDPSVGRFTGVDPIADQFPHVSTYNYAENSPISNIDLWGLQKYFAASGEFIAQNGNDKSMRVVTSGSVQDCQTMSCSELEGSSVAVQESTQENRESTLADWAAQYQGKSSRYSNDPGGNREFAMSLYWGEVTDENGKTTAVFAEGETIKGRKGTDGISLADSKSPIEGWKASESIHSHRFGDNSGAFSDERGSFISSDIPTALKSGNPLHLVVPGSNYIGSFTPKIYNSKIQSGGSRESAIRAAINKNAIKIK